MRPAAAVLVWLCALGGAGALGAWSLANADPGASYGAADPLDGGDVRRGLAEAGGGGDAGADSRTDPPAPSAPGSSASPSPGRDPAADRRPDASDPSAPARTVTFPGGSASARCLPGGDIRLTHWSPAAGYSVEEVARGPAATAVVELEGPGDEGEDVVVVLRCTDGRPVAASAAEDDADDADGD